MIPEPGNQHVPWTQYTEQPARRQRRYNRGFCLYFYRTCGKMEFIFVLQSGHVDIFLLVQKKLPQSALYSNSSSPPYFSMNVGYFKTQAGKRRIDITGSYKFLHNGFRYRILLLGLMVVVHCWILSLSNFRLILCPASSGVISLTKNEQYIRSDRILYEGKMKSQSSL